MITLGEGEICVPCSEQHGVYWANGLVEKEDMLKGAAYWDGREYDSEQTEVDHFYVSYWRDGEDQSGDGLFWECHKDDPGAFYVTRLHV